MSLVHHKPLNAKSSQLAKNVKLSLYKTDEEEFYRLFSCHLRMLLNML